LSQIDDLIKGLQEDMIDSFVTYPFTRQPPEQGAATDEIITWVKEQGAAHKERFESWLRRREFERVALAHKVKMSLLAQAQAHAEEVKAKAVEGYQLFDRYQKTKSENVQLGIVRKLYKMGFVIRPMSMLIIHDEVHTTSINAGSQEWGLYDRVTNTPVPRPGQQNTIEHT
jgi:hypothetical protein